MRANFSTLFFGLVAILTLSGFGPNGCNEEMQEGLQVAAEAPVQDQEQTIVVCTWNAPAECEAACVGIDDRHGNVCVLVNGVAEAWRDRDSDGYPDATDTCPTGWNHNQQADYDGDGVLDGCDNCITIANPDQADLNGNRVGDVCEYLGIDNDGDGYCEGLPRAGGMPGCLSGPVPFKGIGDCNDNDPAVNPESPDHCVRPEE